MVTGSGKSSHVQRPTLTGWPLAVILSAVLFILWPILVGDQTLFYRDLFQQYVGTSRLLHGGGWAGGLLWDPFLNGGQPLLGNPNRFILYPSRILYQFLTPTAGLNWEIALHLLLGGVGVVFLARRLNLSESGSAIAGLSYAIGGMSVSITNHLARLAAYHWMPWILLAVHAGLCERRKDSRWWRAAIPVLFAVQWLTGVAELVAMTALMALGWIAACAGVGARRRDALVVGSGLVVLGVGLAAVQIIPAAEMVYRSDRTSYAESGAFLDWSAHPLRLAEMVVPGFCGPIDVADPVLHYWGAGLSDHGFPLILSLYLGSAAVFLAGIGWMRSRYGSPWPALRVLFAVLVGGALILACGEYLPVVGKLFLKIPGLSVLRFPVKALLAVGIPVALLAGRGCDAWLEDAAVTTRRLGLLALGASTLSLVLALLVSQRWIAPALALAFPGRGDMAAAGLPGPLFHVAAVLFALALVGLTVGLAGTSIRSMFMVVIVAADLVVAAVPILPMAPARLLDSAPELVQDIQDNLTVGRFFRDPDPDFRSPFVEDRAWEFAEAWTRELQSSTAATFLLPMVYHLDIAELGDRRIARLARATGEVDWAGRRNLFHAAAVEVFLTTDAPDTPGFQLASTRATAGGSSLFLYRVVPAPPMARWVAGARQVSSPEKALGMLVTSEFDPRLEVVREMDSPTTRAQFALPRSLQPGTEVWRQVITSPAIGFIVTAVPWHPDLVVEANGRVIPAERVNYAFTGFAVERGRYDLRILFAPRTVFLGGLISILSAVVWLALVVVMSRSRQAPGDYRPSRSSRASSPRSA